MKTDINSVRTAIKSLIRFADRPTATQVINHMVKIGHDPLVAQKHMENAISSGKIRISPCLRLSTR